MFILTVGILALLAFVDLLAFPDFLSIQRCARATPGFLNSFHPCTWGMPSISPHIINYTTSGVAVAKYNNIRFAHLPVPEGIKEGDNVPVIHWVFGGSYSFGSKDAGDGTVNPEGLFDMFHQSHEKFIFVISNYRLGLYGWMSSPKEDMTANVGLHDAFAGLNWTKKYISRFGGDPERITIAGQSAGGGIVTLMLTAYGGASELPFSQAIVLSPDLMPRRDVALQREDVYNEVLKVTNCANLACLRTASSDVLKIANHRLIVETPIGPGEMCFGPGIGFAPFVDGDIIPEAPIILFEQGKFNKKVQRVITGNTPLEGKGMTMDSDMPEAFPKLVRFYFPTAGDETIRRIKKLFPFPADEPKRLAWDWITSVVFACHASSLAKAYGDNGYRFVMSIPPGTHGLDLSYFFFVNNETTPVASPDVVRQTQIYLHQFLYGESIWPPYSPRFRIMDIVEHGFEFKTDPWVANQICPTLFDIIKDAENAN
ncbi:cholinesterase [Nannizzia gypsea CBS 118893]|uniref:Carboxylic ester hydrolase n=1 Tax=Arthroderma gypseum (strain ATCC MYA-4604 / CBS 118893) TaxID=535722 RepID=E4V1W9_ARTGP|nr:cholinesterase [Nannizzia gypsea CBS 118893]EFR04034.1 cholinesterase [Nannizzia gypsea CBS 118893]